MDCIKQNNLLRFYLQNQNLLLQLPSKKQLLFLLLLICFELCLSTTTTTSSWQLNAQSKTQSLWTTQRSQCSSPKLSASNWLFNATKLSWWAKTSPTTTYFQFHFHQRSNDNNSDSSEHHRDRDMDRDQHWDSDRRERDWEHESDMERCNCKRESEEKAKACYRIIQNLLFCNAPTMNP